MPSPDDFRRMAEHIADDWQTSFLPAFSAPVDVDYVCEASGGELLAGLLASSARFANHVHRTLACGILPVTKIGGIELIDGYVSGSLGVDRVKFARSPYVDQVNL